MIPEHLRVLSVSARPSSPPRFGGQVRQHGLMTALARRHEITALSLFDEVYDPREARAEMGKYCDDVVLIPNPNGKNGARTRVQLRSVASVGSFEEHWLAVPKLRHAFDELRQQRRFDVLHLDFPISPSVLQLRAPSAGGPPVVLNTQGVEYDLGRQIARSDPRPLRRLYREINWRKLRRYEHAAFRASDGICVCSHADQARVLADIPSARTALIPNAADIDRFQRRPADPPSDGRTVVFFGLLSFVPNADGLLFFLREVWPQIAARSSDVRLKIIGLAAPPAVREFAGPQVEIAGFVDDLRQELANAAVLVVPLRLGAGTRLKIVEGMAMGLPIVSTRLGAEGIDAVADRELLIEDEPAKFAEAVIRVLKEPELAMRLGRAARKLAVERYSWAAAADRLEHFYRELLSPGAAGRIEMRRRTTENSTSPGAVA